MKAWITKLILIVLALMILITFTFWLSRHLVPFLGLDANIM